MVGFRAQDLRPTLWMMATRASLTFRFGCLDDCGDGARAESPPCFAVFASIVLARPWSTGVNAGLAQVAARFMHNLLANGEVIRVGSTQ